ncbi:hypothetical protein ASG35_07320 [Burkholderia sp. Leaf177]|nr:hypothetical protein ASG35_07320 [Burkholderia sp. Leaf177]
MLAQNAPTIRSISQKYNAATFKKRWFLGGASTYCNGAIRQKSPAGRGVVWAPKILAVPMLAFGCIAGEK